VQDQWEAVVAKKVFKGDFVDELPKAKVEPYRLWFEYLKLAVTDERVSIDKDHYAAWGNISELEFSQWWSQNWRNLFAVPSNVQVIENVESAARALEDGAIVIRISKGTQYKKLISDLTVLHKSTINPKGVSAASDTKARFQITSKRSLHYPTLRAMLKFLQLHRETADLETTCIQYHRWATAWNKRVKEKKQKLALVHVPTFLASFVEEIEAHRQAQKGSFKKVPRSGYYNTLRSTARRYLRRAETILKNITVGKFPGTY